MLYRFGNIFFSLLLSGTTIDEHCGSTNARLRIHLSLSTPDVLVSVLVMRVGGEERGWKEGEAIVFDDSLPHSVWNRTDEESRLVLIFDIWHPQLTLEERKSLISLFPSLEED